jgi:peptidoglycan hydrolase-like protein with peptidoglycan-binding domain
MTKCRFCAGAVLGLLAVVVVVGPGGAESASPPPAASADPKLEAERAAFLALPEADRKATQEALGWLGLYNGAIDGAFGKRTRDSIVAYQQNVGAAPDGVVSAAELAALKAATRQAREAVGFELIDDRVSGVRIGAPLKLLTKFKPSSGDSTLESDDGAISLALRYRMPAPASTPAKPTAPGKPDAVPDLGLAALYARLTAEAAGRKISYKTIKAGEYFVVAGEEKGQKFYLRYDQSPANAPDDPSLRGFAFSYPSARADDLDRVTLAIANAFEPFPDTPASRGAGKAQATSRRAPDDLVRVAQPKTPVIAAAPTPAGARPSPAPSASPSAAAAELAATALIVAPGQALTALPSGACAELSLDGKPAKLLRYDAASGLALIGGDFGAGAQAPGLGVGSDDLIALSVAPAAAGKFTLQASPATPAPAGEGAPAVIAALDSGAGGAPLFDRQGALAGLVAPLKGAPRRVGAVVLAEPHATIAVETIARFLNLAAAPPPVQKVALDVGEVAAAARGAVARVVCRP